MKVTLEIENLLKFSGEIQWLGDIPIVPPYEEQEPINPFNILHSHKFENNPLGAYSYTQKAKDFDMVWVYDNVKRGQPEIVEFDGARRSRNFYAKGTKGFQNGADFGLQPREDFPEEVYLSYKLFFEDGFDPYVSVKLPGFRMIPSIKSGTGLNPNPDHGGTVYLQIDQQFKMNWNVYHHGMSTTNGERTGDPLNFHTIKTGYWMEITMRIVMNTPGIANGILQIWIDGELKNTTTDVMLRTKTTIPKLFNQFTYITFMDSSVAVRKDQSMYADDFKFWTYTPEYLDNNPNVSRGLETHTGEILIP